MERQENTVCNNCIIEQMNSFNVLKKEELKQMAASRQVLKIKKGEAIFREGERLNGVFCVRNGVSKLTKMSNNGRDQILRISAKGGVLGQRSVITSKSSTITATALEDMQVCFIPKSHIQECLQNNPAFSNAMLKHFTDELTFADNLIVNMSQKSVRERLAEALLYLEENFGLDEDGYLHLQLFRSDLADIVGTATELCIRTLSKFKKEKLISTKGKRIKLIDKKGLYLIANDL